MMAVDEEEKLSKKREREYWARVRKMDTASRVKIYTKQLNKSGYDGRKAAIRNLRGVGGVLAIEPLIAATKGNDHYLRSDAAKALSRYNDDRVFPALAALLRDDEYTVRYDAVDAFRALIKRTGEKRSINKNFTLYKHPVAVTSLLEVLDGGDKITKRDVLGLLSLCDDERLFKVFNKYLDDPSSQVRSKAIYAFGKAAGQIDVVLERLTNDNDTEVRESAASALRYFDDARAREVLIKTIKNTGEGKYVRGNALGSVTRFKDPEVTSLIVAMIDDNEVWMRTTSLAFVLQDLSKTGLNRLSRFRGEAGLSKALMRRIKPDEPDYTAKARAMEALGHLKDLNTVEPLIEVLKTGVSGENRGKRNELNLIRGRAAIALGKIGDKSAVKPLIEILKDRGEYMGVRLSASFALADIEDFAAIQPIEDFLKEDLRNSRSRVETALKSLKSAKSEGERRLKLIATIKNTGEDDSVRADALYNLPRYKDTEVNALIVRMIDDEAPDVRRRALSAVSMRPQRYREEEGLAEALMRRLKAERYLELISAIQTLARLGEEKAVEPIIGILKGEFIIENERNRNYVRIEAVKTLGEFGDKRALAPLIDILADRKVSVSLRVEVASALVEIGDPAAIQPIEAFLKEVTPNYRAIVKKHLRSLKSTKPSNGRGEPARAIIKNTGEVQYVRKRPIKDLPELKDPKVVIKMIDDESTDVRWRALNAVLENISAYSDEDGLAPALIRRLKSEQDNLRVMSMRILARLGEKKAVEPIIAILTNESIMGNNKKSDTVRITAAKALGELGDKRALSPLIDILADREESVRFRGEVALALVAIGDPAAIQPIEAFLNEDFGKYKMKVKVEKHLKLLKSAKSGEASGGAN
ncbi:MAG: HEAT repeat domain-containing protein [Thermodesulfobacteriota bacterium]